MKYLELMIAALALLVVACGGGATEAPSDPDPDPAPIADESTEVSVDESAGDEAEVAAAGEGEECGENTTCDAGLFCDGAMGCDVAWTCQPMRPCTRDLVQYCGCDGATFQGSGNCAGKPYASEGPCADG